MGAALSAVANISLGRTSNTLAPPASEAFTTPTNATKASAQLWAQFCSHSIQYHARNHERKTLLVFEDVEAKVAKRQKKMEQLWFHSAEKNSVVFDIRRHTFLGSSFLDALNE